MNKIKKYIDNPWLLYSAAALRRLTNWISDEHHLRNMWKASFGSHARLDLDNPSTFNEKLQWLKLYDRNPAYNILVDKYAVKKWVAERIGDQYVTPVYSKWNNVEDIDVSRLPQQFVLKTNHDCGGVIVCRDRSEFNLLDAKKKLAKSMKGNYYYLHREWPYKDVKPCIFAEKYLEPDGEDVGLVDYKLMCFGGKCECLFTCTGREKHDLRVDFFDLDWNHLPFRRHYPNADVAPMRPKNLDLMIEKAEVLSRGIPFVRVDFYERQDSISFGEMTFYPGSGLEEFTPEEWDRKLGDLIDLSKAYSMRNGAIN